MTLPLLAILVWLIGTAVWAFASNAKLAELGRMGMWVGFAIVLWVATALTTGHTVTLR